ncbi:DnaD domain protein [Brevibacillus daliensis]|uniref:DnaD domain protein n=1 Tax=Brevibacillus daliensis TaxID=2892995 RepID=UPI001E545A5C|nr:DnaD domain protein [Brevibacillus daliensis]
MRLMWNELAPNDRYLVRLIRPLSMMEMGFVTHLYLPLIGVASYSLYQLLVHEVDEKSGAVTEGIHRSLMMMTSLPLDRLLEARERLEAMDLLEVRRRENRDHDFFYEYIIKPPLAPAQFFQEDIWPVMLHNQVGKIKYEQIRRTYRDQLWANLESEYPYEENVTKRFYEVFHTLSASEVELRPGSETERFFAEMQRKHPVSPVAYKDDSDQEKEQILDLSFLRTSLPSNIKSADIMTPEYVQFFYQLITFYQMDGYGLSRELRDWNLYDGKGKLNKDALRKRLVERYVDNQMPRTASRMEELFKDECGPGNIPAPGSHSFLQVCRQCSPLAMLEMVIGGRISRAYLDRAETLVFTEELPYEVVNALLMYALRETKMELPKAYIETIRDSWKAKGISTVDEAVRVILERAEARSQAQEKSAAASASNGKNTNSNSTGYQQRRGKNGRAILQDKLPASVQRQLDREQAETEAQTGATSSGSNEKRSTIMDDPELRELYESLRNPKKGGER